MVFLEIYPTGSEAISFSSNLICSVISDMNAPPLFVALIITYYNLFVNRLFEIWGAFIVSVRNDPLFDHSLTVDIIDAVFDHVTEVSGEKPFDVVFSGSFYLKALI